MLGCAVVLYSQNEVKPPAPVFPIPSAAQMAWHQMEMNAFVHFITNTFTGKEWGFGDENPGIFNPAQANVQQWINIFQKAGFRGVILTAKHHDGFCLWPSTYTHHSVVNSPYKGGKGDIVMEVAEGCKRYGLKMGVYLSPWDRNHARYGTPEYVDYYRNQLKELIADYGPFFEIWFDGANGGDGYYGGAKDTRKIDGRTYYDWPGTINMVNKINPNVIFFSDAGPGCRWVGNEKGVAGETNWNTISVDTLYAGKPNIEQLLNTGSEDGTSWVPAEVDVSIRPGWFYHQEEDSQVKTPEKLFEIYLSSVGRGAVLLLNVPPDRRGLIHENDIQSLKGFRRILDRTFKINLAQKASVRASSHRGNHPLFAPKNLLDDDFDSYWATEDNETTANVEITLKSERTLQYIELQEYIKLGQRVKSFSVEAWLNNQWQTVATGTTIGYKCILPLNSIKTAQLKITFRDSKACLAISKISIY